MSWLLRRHLPLAWAGWRDLDAQHARADENPIQKPWRRTNSGRPVWLEDNVLKIADYSATVFEVGGVSYEHVPFTANFGVEFDLNIDGNVLQLQFWGAAISPSWTKVGFSDLINQPIITIYREVASAVNSIRIIVYRSLSTIDNIADSGTFSGLMNRSWCRMKILVDRDRLVRVYINDVLRLQHWLPADLAGSPRARAFNYLNQTSAWSEQKNFRLFDHDPIFRVATQWISDYADTFNRADGAVGAPWTQYGVNAQIVSNSWASIGTADGTRLLLQQTSDTSGAQRVEAIIGGSASPNTTTAASLLLRVNGSGTEGLAANIFSSSIFIAFMSGGPTNPTFTDFTSTPITITAGDHIAFSITGDGAWVEVNGVVVLAADINGALPASNSWRGLRVSRRSFTYSASWNSVSLFDAA